MGLWQGTPAQRRRGNARVLLFMLAPAGFLLMSAQFFLPRDNWWRDVAELARQFPAGDAPHHVLLENEGTAPLFVEIRCEAWEETRSELVLPRKRQWVSVPTDGPGGGRMQLDATVLDLPAAAHFVFDVPFEWNHTTATIDEEGLPSVRSRPRGDSSPKRYLVVLETEYRYPVRVELPYDGHERPTGSDAERMAWAGPGTGYDSAQCAAAIRPGVQIVCAVPRLVEPDLRIDEAVTSGTTTHLFLGRRGGITRGAIPLSRTVQHWAGF